MQRSMLRVLIGVGFICLALTIIKPENLLLRSFVLGLALGLLNYRILGRSVRKAVVDGEGGARKNAVIAFAARYVLIALGLCVVAGDGTWAITTYTAGVLLPYAAIVLTGILLPRARERS